MIMETMNYNNKKILIAGLGYRTGLASGNFLAGRGAQVSITDTKSREDLAPVIEKLDSSVKVIAGNQDPSLLDEGYELVVLSPGVPQRIPLIREAQKRGIPVISEIELAYRHARGNIIAITGTDGKSTTTALTGHILRELGFDARVGGNIGIPFISLVDDMTDDTISVIELSSFQLETVASFRPDAAAILNVTPDHLDRYDSIDEYYSAKLRIAMNQNRTDTFLYNMDDAVLAAGFGRIAAKQISFSYDNKKADAYCDRDYIYIRYADNLIQCLDTARLQILGAHNVLNTMAAILLVLAVMGKRLEKPDFNAIAHACYSFRGLAHRMEKLGEYEGRTFINDSKATTVGALEMALRSFPGNIVLILGGRTKGDDYSRLSPSMKKRVKSLVLIGESSQSFGSIFHDFSPAAAGSLDEAVVIAMRTSGRGDIVLLSPACASFDMFTSYEDRGDSFRRSFEKLQRGELSWT
ncbi:MAG TPA: UDP-N-acetylmuramoyl-L-alanine--D-glutamate ligase [Spirochaetota bacterium]|nr:UDP-N-acetylmuramoyl-L-alanine--D-glutamate ligase [Spirochaetota bacterium]